MLRECSARLEATDQLRLMTKFYVAIALLVFVGLPVLALWVRSSLNPSKPVKPIQFGLGSVFAWTTLWAVCAFVAAYSWPAGILLACGMTYSLGFAFLLRLYDRIRPSGFAKWVMFLYLTLGAWAITSAIMPLMLGGS
jgi:hypothetical protein